MNLREYQLCASQTEQKAKIDVPAEIVPLLGLVGEAGELLSEYKKYLRDGSSHQLFNERVAEELGDLLWYVADVASKFNLDLEKVAEDNLDKCRDRWGSRNNEGRDERPAPVFDAHFPEDERLPRHVEIELTSVENEGSVKMRAFVNGVQLGNDLTDNAHTDDGYRFHDIFHFACAAILGWSPVTRKIFACKRKSDLKIDEVEDGGRAAVIEEGISALVFSYTSAHANLEDVTSLDYKLLRTIKDMTAHLEVSLCSLRDWERAILAAYEVWRAVERNGGGVVIIDLDAHSIKLKEVD